MKIRDVLLIVYSVGWLAAVGVALWQTKKVDAELWAGLAGGVGLILGLFRNEAPQTSPPADRTDTSEDAR